MRQHTPFAIVLDADENVDAVAAFERAVRRDRGVGETHALRRLAAFKLQQRHRHPVGHGVEHRDRKLGTFAGARAPDQGFEDRLIGIQAGRDIDDGYPDARRLVRTGDRGETRLRLDQKVVGLARGERTRLAETGNAAADQPRQFASQLRDREAELFDRAGFQILHEHIGAFEHGGQQRPVGGRGEIEHDRFLAAIEPDEIAALAVRERVVGACEIAFGPFDLDDTRAGIRQLATAHGRGDRLFERDDEQSGKGK